MDFVSSYGVFGTVLTLCIYLFLISSIYNYSKTGMIDHDHCNEFLHNYYVTGLIIY